MMATSWRDFRAALNLTPEEEEIINLEKSAITATIDVLKQNGLTQKQLPELCGVPPAQSRRTLKSTVFD